MPSINICLVHKLTMWNSACTKVDFLPPVLPTIPGFIPPHKVQVTPLKPKGRFSAYCICMTFKNLGGKSNWRQKYICFDFMKTDQIL